ncbi:MAG: metal-dependent hydrolase [Candidatus Aenigmatarchaeota archaeon]
MKWINHKAITFSVTYYLSGNIFYSLISALGAIFPDWIEGFDYLNPNWKKRHRTYSHWWILYVAVLLATTFIFFSKFHIDLRSIREIIVSKTVPLDNIVYLSYSIFFWFIIGCLFHIVQDAFTGSIPILTPAKKVKWFRITRTGTIWEYAVSIALVILIFVLK